MCKEWMDVIMSSADNTMVVCKQIKHEEYTYSKNGTGEVVVTGKKVDTENTIGVMKMDGKSAEKAITVIADSGNSSYGCCIY